MLEPKLGGRWYELGTDGSQVDWGRVLAWEPSQRVVLAWQITSAWHFDPDFVTEVEVTFAPEGATQTRVVLIHRQLERFGAAAEGARAALEGGWAGLLAVYQQTAQS